MEILDFKELDAVALEKALDVLKSGGVVMHATETCYGLAADIRDEEAIRKVYEIKGRDFKKPVSIFVADLEMAKMYGEFDDLALSFAEKYWPGPLSILVRRTEKLSKFLNPNEEFVSMRVSGMKFCREIVKRLGAPITTTSANLSGTEALYKIDLSGFEILPDLVLDFGKLDESNLPSTLLKIDGDKCFVLRQGGVVIV